jgi:hypothetical protein
LNIELKALVWISYVVTQLSHDSTHTQAR